MSKKHKQHQEPPPKKKKSTPTIAVAGTIILIFALIALFTYQP